MPIRLASAEGLLQRELGAAADCEAIRDGILGQPVNSATTIAFLAAAIVVGRHPDRRLVAWGLAATGAGSWLFHGPMVPGSTWAHDVGLAWLLVIVAADQTRWSRWAGLPALAGLSVVLTVAPAVSEAGFVVLSAAAVGGVLWRDRSRATIVAMALLGIAAAVGRLSATGNPLCRPESWLQGHGFWHLASAAAVTLWAVLGRRPRRSPRRELA